MRRLHRSSHWIAPGHSNCSCVEHFDYWVWVIGIGWIDQDQDGVWDDHEVPLQGVHFLLMEVGTEDQFDHNTSANNGNAELEAHWACESGLSCHPNRPCTDLGSRLVAIASTPEASFPTTPLSQHMPEDGDTLFFGFGHW